MVDDLHFEVLENGLDFVSSGLAYIARGETKSDLKYGVLHLAAGIELILKERLRLEDWRLVFVDIDRANETLYNAGDFRSVGQKESLARLEEYCGIEIKRADKEKLAAFRVRRNRLEHFAIVVTKVAIESLAAQALGVLLDFIGEAFADIDLRENENQLIQRIRERLNVFNAFAESRLAEIFAESNPRKAELVNLLECPTCLRETLRPDVSVECFFCGYRADGDEAADYFIAQNPNASARKYYCPECGNKTLVDLGVNGGATPSTEFLCFGCGSRWDEGALVVCFGCDQIELAGFMTQIGCRQCFNSYVSRDNT